MLEEIESQSVNKDTLAAIELSAVKLLANREHSEQELKQKLGKSGYQLALVDKVLRQLIQAGLQSDKRFCESYIRSACARGHGPYKISQALAQKGIGESLQEAVQSELEIDWVEQAKQVKEKKFGQSKPINYKEATKQMRFIQQRGFSAEQIRALYPSSEL